MSDYTKLEKMAEAVNHICRDIENPQMVIETRTLLGLIAELKRVKVLNYQQFGDAIRKNAEVDALKKENARLTNEVNGLIESPGDAL